MTKTIAKGLAYILLFIVAIPAGVFVIGSITGDHSLRYDREGTWLCWMPHDRMHRDCTLLTSFVPVNRLDDIAPSARGYIRCGENGRLEIGNFDIQTEIKGPPLNLDAYSCDARKQP